MEWIESLPKILQILLAISGGITALLVSLHYWTKASKKNRVEENITEERIRELLKEENDLLDHKINTLTITIEEQAKEICELKKTQGKLQADNEILTKIFQGRDEDALDFREETRNGLKKNGEKIDKIIEHMDKIYRLLEKNM